MSVDLLAASLVGVAVGLALFARAVGCLFRLLGAVVLLLLLAVILPP